MVFKVRDSSSAENQDDQKVADSILGYFCGFEAFLLPPPTVDKELLKKINDNKSQMNPFFRALDLFKRILGNVLTPKKSFNEGELVTGEGLAALVQLYVEAINSPGVIPNIQNAWETFVETKCSEAIEGAVKMYEEVMKSNLEDERACDNDEFRKIHGTALEKGEGYFMTETVGISTNTTEKFLNKLKEMFKEKLISWKTRNEKLTRELCNRLLIQLKEKHLEPVLRQLQGKEAAKMSFDEIIDGYNHIKKDYHNSAIGAKDVIAAVFFEFHPALLKEQKQYLSLLGQLKDYDEELAQELTAKAFQEQEKQRLEEEQERLRQENLAVKNEMEMLSRKQNEERQKLREQMENELRAQREQMNNMMEANMKSAKQDRELLVQQNQDLKNKFLENQKANEDNMKEIANLRDLLAKQNEEKLRLSEQMELKSQAASERQEQIRVDMEERHKREQEELRRQIEANMKRDFQEYKDASAKREQDMEKKFSEQMEKKAFKEREDLVTRMEAKHKQQQDDMRREMEEKRKWDLYCLQSQHQEYKDASAKREQDTEKKFREQMFKEREDVVTRMEAKHKQQQDDLRREMEKKREWDLYCLQSHHQAAADARLQEVTSFQGKMQAVEEELTELKKPGFFKSAWTKVTEVGSAVFRNCSIM